MLLSTEESPVILSSGALREPGGFGLKLLRLPGTRTPQRAQGNCRAERGNFSVCRSEWKQVTANTCRGKERLENILFMPICSKFLFVLQPFITHVFPYCLFGSAKQIKYWSEDLIFHSLSHYTGRTRVAEIKRTALAEQITWFMWFGLTDCRVLPFVMLLLDQSNQNLWEGESNRAFLSPGIHFSLLSFLSPGIHFSWLPFSSSGTSSDARKPD